MDGSEVVIPLRLDFSQTSRHIGIDGKNHAPVSRRVAAGEPFRCSNQLSKPGNITLQRSAPAGRSCSVLEVSAFLIQSINCNGRLHLFIECHYGSPR